MDNPGGSKKKTEEALVRGCQANEREAFKTLFSLHGEFIRRIAIRMSANKQMSEDIFQEVVKQVILNIGSFNGKSRVSTWLYRITVNSALQIIRAEKRYAAAQIHEESIAGTDDVASKYEQRDLRRRVMKYLAALPGRQRQCASMFYFADMSVTEISNALSIEENAVKAALFKARKNLMHHMQKKGLLVCA